MAFVRNFASQVNPRRGMASLATSLLCDITDALLLLQSDDEEEVLPAQAVRYLCTAFAAAARANANYGSRQLMLLSGEAARARFSEYAHLGFQVAFDDETIECPNLPEWPAAMPQDMPLYAVLIEEVALSMGWHAGLRTKEFLEYMAKNGAPCIS